MEMEDYPNLKETNLGYIPFSSFSIESWLWEEE